MADVTLYERTQEILAAVRDGRLHELTDDELVEWEEREHSALYAWPTEGSRRAWAALNAEVARRGLAR